MCWFIVVFAYLCLLVVDSVWVYCLKCGYCDLIAFLGTALVCYVYCV